MGGAAGEKNLIVREASDSETGQGDLIAGFGVALVAIPAGDGVRRDRGTGPVHGLYPAVAAALGGALVGSSPYLQNRPQQ